jgi:hypothetical protein
MKSCLKRQALAPFAGDEIHYHKDQGFSWPKHLVRGNYLGLRIRKERFENRLGKSNLVVRKSRLNYG